MKRIVSVLHPDQWPSTPRVVTLIEEFAKQRGIGIEIEHVPVNTDEEAQAHKFIGGPTVRINGLDVDPAARGVTEYGFGWRVLNWTQDAATIETLLINAFQEAGWLNWNDQTLANKSWQVSGYSGFLFSEQARGFRLSLPPPAL